MYEINTDRQEVHVCLDDKVFCMEGVERGYEGGEGRATVALIRL